MDLSGMQIEFDRTAISNASQSARGQAHSKTLREVRGRRAARQRPGVRRSSLIITHKYGRPFGQSQRDCDLQPRVASLRATLGVRGPGRFNPNGVVAFRPAHGHNPVGVLAA